MINANKVFIRYNWHVGDSVRIKRNQCGHSCGCYWTKDKYPGINTKKTYTIKQIYYFGGGCPSTLLSLEELPETHGGIDNALPANWFQPFTPIIN